MSNADEMAAYAAYRALLDMSQYFRSGRVLGLTTAGLVGFLVR